MKVIENWEAIEIIDNKEVPAIIFPGCKLKGELDGNNVIIDVLDVNLSKLYVIDNKKVKYILSGARQSYIDFLNAAIEFSKEKESVKYER